MVDPVVVGLVPVGRVHLARVDVAGAVAVGLVHVEAQSLGLDLGEDPVQPDPTASGEVHEERPDDAARGEPGERITGAGRARDAQAPVLDRREPRAAGHRGGPERARRVVDGEEHQVTRGDDGGDRPVEPGRAHHPREPRGLLVDPRLPLDEELAVVEPHAGGGREGLSALCHPRRRRLTV